MVYVENTSEHKTRDYKTTSDTACSLEIEHLPINTTFVVKVRACTDTEHGPVSDESSPITTRNLAYKMKDVSTLRSGSTDELSVYDVPVHVERDEQLKIRTVRIGIDTIRSWIYFYE